MRSATVVTGLAAAVLFALATAPASGQSLELEVRRARIDQRPAPLERPAAYLPPGFGVVARGVLRAGPFLELEASRGADTRRSAICGYHMDPSLDCIPESVRYRGGLVAGLVGWRFRFGVGERLDLAMRPRVGLGAVWTSELGTETGRRRTEHPPTLVAGVFAEALYRLPGPGLGLIASLGADTIRPGVGYECADCFESLTYPMPQWSVGVGVSWGGR
jgi:hypothetical protein